MVGLDGRFDLNNYVAPGWGIKLVIWSQSPPSPNRGEWGIQLTGALASILLSLLAPPPPPPPPQSQVQSQNLIKDMIKESPSMTAGTGVESQIAHQSLKRAAAVTKEQEAVRKKYNLNKWKYAELRDTINTSVGQRVG